MHTVEFDEIYMGYRIVGLLNNLGFRTGYVQVSSVLDPDELEVHGGITYDRDIQDFPVAGGGRWIGFDCAHLGDLPDMELCQDLPQVACWFGMGGVVRTAEFVREQCQGLVDQLTV